MSSYYTTRLAAERLRRCYELAPPRVRQYLRAEIDFVAARLRATDVVLEIGCGYGRVMFELAGRARRVVGADLSNESLVLAQAMGRSYSSCSFCRMDARALGFGHGAFDAVLCVQNGICAFNVDPIRVLDEAVRVAAPGGLVLLSTYSPRFWPERLAWFEAQAAAGLVGPIDRTRTREGTIVCTDGFRAGTLTPDALTALCRSAGVTGEIVEVDGSSIFCVIGR